MSVPAIPRRQILVVDDEPLVCEAVKMMLNFDGHEVDICHTGKDALELLEQRAYDLVITDYKMPGMKGDELAQRVKSQWPQMPVVMITAYVELLENSKGAYNCGVDHVLSKPFLLESLREAILKVASKNPAP
jgi:two-component system, OmpR family, response regulator ArlR